MSSPGGLGEARAQPFYCPYCGEEDFVPFGDENGRFHCNSCGRHFIVKFLGLAAPARETAAGEA